jgi:hypothetical protein
MGVFVEEFTFDGSTTVASRHSMADVTFDTLIAADTIT